MLTVALRMKKSNKKSAQAKRAGAIAQTNAETRTQLRAFFPFDEDFKSGAQFAVKYAYYFVFNLRTVRS
jgi:hypothetical protein